MNHYTTRGQPDLSHYRDPTPEADAWIWRRHRATVDELRDHLRRMLGECRCGGYYSPQSDATECSDCARKRVTASHPRDRCSSCGTTMHGIARRGAGVCALCRPVCAARGCQEVAAAAGGLLCAYHRGACPAADEGDR